MVLNPTRITPLYKCFVDKEYCEELFLHYGVIHSTHVSIEYDVWGRTYSVEAEVIACDSTHTLLMCDKIGSLKIRNLEQIKAAVEEGMNLVDWIAAKAGSVDERHRA